MLTKVFKFNKVEKKVLKLLLIISIIFIIYTLSLTFPHVLLKPFFFNDYISYENFKVYYSESNITKKIIIDNISNAKQKLKKSELYENYEFKIFNCSNSFKYHYIVTSTGNIGFFSELTGHIFMNTSEVNKLICLDKRVSGKRTLSSLFAHECTHKLIKNKYGTKIPDWINEGYAEYIAQESWFDDVDSLAFLKRNDEQSIKVQETLIYKYFIYRVLIKYLIEVRNFDIDTIINSNLEYNDVLKEVKNNLNKIIFK